MHPLLQKLNFKGKSPVVILNSPDEFFTTLKMISKEVEVLKDVPAQRILFVLAFVKSREEISRFAGRLIPLIEGDAIMWFAYPKKTSKKYKSELSRDAGWEVIGKGGFAPVRQIAIDDDWSALRFRNTKYLKDFIPSKNRALPR